jgi:hypothetical protein
MVSGLVGRGLLAFVPKEPKKWQITATTPETIILD